MRSEWPEPGSWPRCRDGTSAVSLDDNLAIYDDVGHLPILLNVAAAVWSRCDGVAPFQEIVADLVTAHAGDIDEITVDARLTVRRLAELGLAEETVDPKDAQEVSEPS